MIHRRFRAWVFSLALLVLGQASAHAQDEIAVATVGPLSGQLAAFGNQMKRGADLAVTDINASGGVLGKKLRLIIDDDACDPAKAIEVAQRLVREKVIFVAGHFCSAASIAASAVYHETGILEMTPASTRPALTDDAATKGWKNIFRIVGNDRQQGFAAADYLASHFKGTKIAIIHDDSLYGDGLASATRTELINKGFSGVMYEAITRGEKDFAALLSKMKQDGVSVVFFNGSYIEGGLLVRQARNVGFTSQFVSTDALAADEFWAIAGADGKGTLMIMEPDPSDLASAKSVVERLEKQGFSDLGYSVYTYAAFQVFKEAATKVGSIKLESLSDILHKDKFETSIGPIAFDEQGDRRSPLYLPFIWQEDGGYTVVKSEVACPPYCPPPKKKK